MTVQLNKPMASYGQASPTFGASLRHSTYLDHGRWGRGIVIDGIWNTFVKSDSQPTRPKDFMPLYVAYDVTKDDIAGDQYFVETGIYASPVYNKGRSLYDNIASPDMTVRSTGKTVNRNQLVPRLLKNGLSELAWFAKAQQVGPDSNTPGFIVFEGKDQVRYNLLAKIKFAIEKQVIPGMTENDYKWVGASLILKVPNIGQFVQEPKTWLGRLVERLTPKPKLVVEKPTTDPFY